MTNPTVKIDDSGPLLELLALQLQEHGVSAVVVTGVTGATSGTGDGSDPEDVEQVVAAFPDAVMQLSSLFNVRHRAGPDVEECLVPQVSWLDLRSSSLPCRDEMLALDLQSVVRVRMPVIESCGFEVMLFSRRGNFHPESSGMAVWCVLAFWPRLKHALALERCRLSRRERECLNYSFRGLTAAQTAALMACAERTVRLHLSNASKKLGSKNMAGSIRNALMIGAL